MESEKHLYDSIGIDYNQTRIADSFIVERLFSHLSSTINSPTLDIGCGTGNYTVALASKGHLFYGIDPSQIMLQEAKRKSNSVIWAQAVAEDLPFDNEFFGAALASLTIHHWKNLETGFAEVYRLLKPNSNFVIFTAYPEQMKGYWLNYYFSKMLKDSMIVMPSRQTIERALDFAGFTTIKEEKYFIKSDLQDLFLYSGKQRPYLYLEAKVRKVFHLFRH